MLYFNVEIETAFAAVNLLTAFVWTHEISVNFFSRSPHVLFANFFFAPRFVSAQSFCLFWFKRFLSLLHFGLDFLFLKRLLVLDHFNPIKILFREREQLWQQTCLVVILYVVNPFKGL